jgi:hypothetical protein
MKVPDKLFQLIKSLTKAEKRYFKLFTSIYGGKKNYHLLFDAIDAQEAYDEDRLRDLFGAANAARQLQVTKGYLYDQILRCLRVFHAGTSVRGQIRDLTQNIEILYEKGLREQAYRMYETALEIATEHEEFISMIHLLSWGTRLRGECDSEEGVTLKYAPLYAALDKFRDYLDHLCAMQMIGSATKMDSVRTPGDLDAVERAIGSIPDADAALTVKARILYCWTYATYHFLRGDVAEAWHYTEQQVAHYEENPSLTAVDPSGYVFAMSNRMYYLRTLGMNDEFGVAADAMRERVERLLATYQLWSPRLRAHLFTTLYRNQISWHVESNNRARFPELAAAVERGLGEHACHMRPDTVLWFRHFLVVMYRGTGEMRRAIDCNNVIVQDAPPATGRALYYHARLLKLLLHYEMGHTDLLDYLVVSTYRYFRSRDIIYGFEGIVFDFFRRLMRLKGGPGGVTRALHRHARASCAPCTRPVRVAAVQFLQLHRVAR